MVSVSLLVFTLICGVMTFLQFFSNVSLKHPTGWWDRVGANPPPYSKVPLESPGSFRHVSRFVTRDWTYERWHRPNPIRLPWRHYARIDQWVIQNNEAAVREWLFVNTPGWTARGYERGSTDRVLISFRSVEDAVLFTLTWG